MNSRDKIYVGDMGEPCAYIRPNADGLPKGVQVSVTYPASVNLEITTTTDLDKVTPRYNLRGDLYEHRRDETHL